MANDKRPPHSENAHIGKPRMVIEMMDDRMAEVLRSKTGAERLQIANDMFESARSMLLYHLQTTHPEWNPQQLQREVARRLSHGAV